jgi:soluble lytic murein transglycosylase-like protein
MRALRWWLRPVLVAACALMAAGDATAAPDWDSLRVVTHDLGRAARIARVGCDPAALLEHEGRYARQLADASRMLTAVDPATLSTADGPAIRALLLVLLAARDEAARDWLRQHWPVHAPALDPNGEVRFWVGLDALERDDWLTAEACLKPPAPPLLEPYAEWLHVRALDGIDGARAGERALEILARNPGHAFRGLLTMRAARHLVSSGRASQARQMLERYLGQQAPEDFLRAAAFTWLAEIHRAAARTGEFHQAFCQAARIDAGSNEAGTLRLELARGILKTDQDSAKALPARVLEASIEVISTLSSARDGMSEWTRWSPRLTHDARSRLATSLLDGLNRAKADTLLLRLAQTLALSAADTSGTPVYSRRLRARANLMAARVYRRGGNRALMVSAFCAASQADLDPAVMSSNERETAGLALVELARELEDLGDWEGAARFYGELGERFPADAGARDAGIRGALCAYHAGQTADALARLERLCADAPHNLTGAPCLWRALLGPDEQRRPYLVRGSRETHPGYYAKRAAGALAWETATAGRDSLFWADLTAGAREPQSWPWPTIVPLAPELSARSLVDLLEDQPAAQVGTLFLAYNFPRWGRQAFTQLPGWRALEPRERAALLRALGDIEESIRTGIQSKDALARYPVAFAAEVAEAAERFHLSPALVLAVMRQESLFASHALSRAGAQGLMQLMPATARRMADSLGWRDYDVSRPRDNILLGTCHLAELLAATGGRLPVALAAYNAGPDRARRWWSQARGLDDFIERIGFSETRGFVRNVITHYGYYQSLYRANRAAPATTH